MVKIAITGHTSGIGKAFFQSIQEEIIGFSKSNGFDITNIESRKEIINLSNDCDIFINNAHDEFGQTEFLIELFKEWKDYNRQIINIGSRAAHVIIPRDKLDLLPYAAQKLALKETVKNCQGYNCKVDYIRWGYVGTDSTFKKYPNMIDYIKLDEAVEQIKKLINYAKLDTNRFRL